MTSRQWTMADIIRRRLEAQGMMPATAELAGDQAGELGDQADPRVGEAEAGDQPGDGADTGEAGRARRGRRGGGG